MTLPICLSDAPVVGYSICCTDGPAEGAWYDGAGWSNETLKVYPSRQEAELTVDEDLDDMGLVARVVRVRRGAHFQ